MSDALAFDHLEEFGAADDEDVHLCDPAAEEDVILVRCVVCTQLAKMWAR